MIAFNLHQLMTDFQEDKSIRNTLLGIQLNNFKVPAKFEFGRWKVYELPPIKIIEGYRRHVNFQINGTVQEKIIVRTWLSADYKKIIKIRYYYLKSTDPELANYIVRALIAKLSQKYPLANSVKFVELNYC